MDQGWLELVLLLVLIGVFVLVRRYRAKRRHASSGDRLDLAHPERETADRVTAADLLQPGEQIEYEKKLQTGSVFTLTNIRTIRVDASGEVQQVPLRGLRNVSVHATGSWPNQSWFVGGMTPAGSVDIASTKERRASEEIALHIQTAILKAST